MHGGELLSGVNAISNGDGMMQNEVDSRKLVILGLPWDTTEGSLEQHFSQIGPLQVRTAHIGLLSRRGPSPLHVGAWQAMQSIQAVTCAYV